jgi:hypothetical protein
VELLRSGGIDAGFRGEKAAGDSDLAGAEAQGDPDLRRSFPPIWRKDGIDLENTGVFFVASPHSSIISSLHCL